MAITIADVLARVPCDAAKAWLSGYTDAATAWRECANPAWMLWAVDEFGCGDERRYRLFACRCVRKIWHLLPDERSKRAVEVSERFADGLASLEELRAARAAAVATDAAAAGAAAVAAAVAAATVLAVTLDDSLDFALDAAGNAALAVTLTAGSAARDWQCDILRELFPFA